MRALAWLMALLLPLLFAAACGDLSTVPTAPERAAVPSDHALTSCYGTIAGGVYCEPISNDPECDPWMSLNWCQDDNCEMSEPGMGDPEHVGIAGCNNTGPGTGSPVPGGGYNPPPSSGVDPYKQYQDDANAACPPCGERAPTDAEKQTMQSLLPQVQCTDGQNTLSQMLNNGTLLVYTQDNGLYGGWNSDTGQIFISQGRHWDASGNVNSAELIDTMVHEAVHKLLGHVNGQPAHETHGQAFKDKMAGCGFAQP